MAYNNLILASGECSLKRDTVLSLPFILFSGFRFFFLRPNKTSSQTLLASPVLQHHDQLGNPCCFHSNTSISSTREPKTWHNPPSMFSQLPSKQEETLSLTCLLHFCYHCPADLKPIASLLLSMYLFKRPVLNGIGYLSVRDCFSLVSLWFC